MLKTDKRIINAVPEPVKLFYMTKAAYVGRIIRNVFISIVN